MEETTIHKTSPYVIPGLPFKLSDAYKIPITKVIADAWEIPEDKVLCSTEIIPEKHPSPFSTQGKRIQIPGERHTPYANARKCYFYIMREVMGYSYAKLSKITGRKVAAMKYAKEKAMLHMALEKDFKNRTQFVLNAIERDKVIFPTACITLEANATVISRRGADETPPEVQLSETGQ